VVGSVEARDRHERYRAHCALLPEGGRSRHRQCSRWPQSRKMCSLDTISLYYIEENVNLTWHRTLVCTTNGRVVGQKKCIASRNAYLRFDRMSHYGAINLAGNRCNSLATLQLVFEEIGKSNLSQHVCIWARDEVQQRST